MATDDQDFSFPTTIDALLPSSFMESPPFWWMTSVASRHEKLTKGGENGRNYDRTNSFSSSFSKKAYYVQRKSFSYVEWGTRRKIEDDHSDDDDDEEEENMDMLWEDYFNEEIKRSKTISNNLSPRGNKVRCKCGQALKLSKVSKMPSIVVFIKLLKKVFLLHKSNPSFKKQSY